MADEEIKRMAVKLAMEDASFQQGVKNLNKQLGVLDSEFKSSVAGVKNWGSNIDALKNNSEALSNKIEIQKQKVSLYRSELEKVQGALGQNSQKMIDLKSRLTEASAAYDKSKNDTEATAESTKKLKEELDKLQKQYTVAENVVKRNASSIDGYKIQVNNATGALNKMEAELKDTNKAIANNDWNKISKGLTKMSDGFRDVGRNMTMYFSTAVVAGGVAISKFASDLNESTNKVDVAFAENAQSVKDWSNTTLKSFGLAKGTSLDMASNFGDMATSMGLSTNQAAKMSKSLVGLAGDLSSFKNIGIDIANTGVTAVFTGETESLKKLGIVMTEVNLQEFAYSQGIKTKIQDMGQNEKVHLRFNYLMEKTKNAQGDFARTGGEAANEARVFKESLKEAAGELGDNLLPIITPVIKKTGELVQEFGKLDSGTQGFVLILIGIAAGIGPVLMGFAGIISSVTLITKTVKAWEIATKGQAAAQWLLNAAMDANPVGLIVLAVAALVAGLWLLYNAYNEGAKAAKAASDAEIAANNKALAAIKKNLQTKESAEGDAYDARVAQIKAEYDKEIAAGEKLLDEKKKALAERVKLADQAHDAEIKRIDDEYGVFEDKEKSKTEIVQDEYNRKTSLIEEITQLSADAASQEGATFAKTYDAILNKARDIHNEKIAMYEREYLASIGLINSDTAAKVKALQNEIDGINGKTQAEQAADKKASDAKKIIDLQAKVNAAKNNADRAAATQELNNEIQRQQREAILVERQNRIDALQKQITDVVSNANSQKDQLLVILKNKIAGETKVLKSQSDETIARIQAERKAKEAAENSKYAAAKKALDNESTYLDGWLESKYKPSLQKKLNQELANEKIRHDKIIADYDLEIAKAEAATKAKNDTSYLNKLYSRVAQVTADYNSYGNTNPLNVIQKTAIGIELLAAQSDVSKEEKRLHDAGIPGFATGVKNFAGGAARVNEDGGEILNLPTGTNVIPHDISMELARELARSVGDGLRVSQQFINGGNNLPNITIPIYFEGVQRGTINLTSEELRAGTIAKKLALGV